MTELTTQPINETLNTFTPHFNDVPVDIYRFFGIDLGTAEGKQFDRLKDIAQWTFSDVETLGDGLSKLKQLEIKMGAPKMGQNREDRIHNYIKLQRNINDLVKRQEAL